MAIVTVGLLPVFAKRLITTLEEDNPVEVQVMLCVSPIFHVSPPFGEVTVIDGVTPPPPVIVQLFVGKL